MPIGPSSPDVAGESEAYLARLLEETGVELGPKPERVSEAYANERIREKIMSFENERQRAGLWSVDHALRERDVPAALRLHLITSVVHLGRIGKDSLATRREQGGA